MITIGVIGGGFVGTATALLECSDLQVLVWDMDEKRRKPADLTLERFLSESSAFFICVPTPMDLKTGACNTGIVEKVIAMCKPTGNLIYVRSTVPAGCCRKWGVNFMPEFLTEKNWAKDFYECSTWVLGGDTQKEEAAKMLQSILTAAKQAGRLVSDRLEICTTVEAEMIKYGRNTFLATKVAFFNEIESLSSALGADYSRVAELLTADPRIGKSHSMVPGHDGQRGFGGTCLPKDISSLIHQFKQAGVRSPVLVAVQQRNDEIDRSQKDWQSDVGRAVSHE